MNTIVQSQEPLENYLEYFFQHLSDAKNSSPKTIENYALRLGRFVEFVGDKTPNQIIAFQVLQFRKKLKDQ